MPNTNTPNPNVNIPNATTLLEFANLQMAAEALYDKQASIHREAFLFFSGMRIST